MEKEIKSFLCEILPITKNEISHISVDDKLEEYGLDSIRAIELVVWLEDKYEITIVDNDLLLDNLCTIKKIINIVDKYLKDKKKI